MYSELAENDIFNDIRCAGVLKKSYSAYRKGYLYIEDVVAQRIRIVLKEAFCDSSYALSLGKYLGNIGIFKKDAWIVRQYLTKAESICFGYCALKLVKSALGNDILKVGVDLYYAVFLVYF